MADRHITEIINEALNGLPWPCCVQTSDIPDDGIYLTWYMLPTRSLVYASGRCRRQAQVAQVSIYSAEPVVDEIRTVVRALRAAGLRVTQQGAQGYDSATERYNSPIIVEHAVMGDEID